MQCLHDDLLRNLQSEIAKQEGTPPREATIRELVADRDWLFASDNYHIDTSHLHSVVRFARQVTDVPTLRLAADLTEYGRRLSSQYQYPGEEPFTDSQACARFVLPAADRRGGRGRVAILSRQGRFAGD